MPFTLDQLADELFADPKALNYGVFWAQGDPGSIALALNTTYPGVGLVLRQNVTAREIMRCLVWDEVKNFTAAQVAWVQALLTPGAVDASDSTTDVFFQGLFASCPLTLAAITTVAAVKPATRAQELWGEDATVTWEQVNAAIALRQKEQQGG